MTPSVVRTRVTELLRCRYPVLLPGMSWISKPELVAAVCNAGGCGILATGPLTADETREAIHEIRKQTNKTFGIGATLLMPGAVENAQVALEEKVPLINVSLGKADWIAKEIHSYGGTLLATVTTARHAHAAMESGADALMVTGYEAAAHGSDVGSMTLIPSMAQEFPNVPLIAAGGIANGQGLAAALSLGADGVAMGSRLAVSEESSLSQNAKEAICLGTVSDTVYGSNFDGIPARVLKTPFSEKLMDRPTALPIVAWRALEAASTFGIPVWKVLPGLLTQWSKLYAVAQFGAATKVLQRATVDGDLEKGVQFVGQSQGVIRDIASVEETMQQIIKQATEASASTARYFAEDDHQLLEDDYA
mmetsp:Transcript_29997/g.45704  ORF Transcript_29997/g.45704 Transcript_29997/m.45704 type:complete len:363 (-) Transcript_29997:35-1123(-)